MMSNRHICLIAIAVLIFWAAQASDSTAEVYKWTDADGNVHYTNLPEAIPSRYWEQTENVPADKDTSSKPTLNHVPAAGETVLPGATFVAPLQSVGGGYVTPVSLNNAPAQKFIVDTGASLTVISPPVAKTLGYKNLDSLPRMPVSTAAGASSMGLISLKSVNVSGATAYDVIVGVSTELDPSINGLLGMNYLSEFVYQVDSMRGKLLLITPGAGEEELYGGRPAHWWRTRFADLSKTAKDFEDLSMAMSVDEQAAKIIRSRVGDITAAELARLGAFYRGELQKLHARADRDKAPVSVRANP
jgi:clan AA aspartic protease (TIGR02281 family)